MDEPQVGFVDRLDNFLEALKDKEKRHGKKR